MISGTKLNAVAKINAHSALFATDGCMKVL
jgi:hypothetical protein